MKFTPNAPMLLLRRLARSVASHGPRRAIGHSYQRLFRSLSKHGLSGTLDRAFRKPPVAPQVAAPAEQPNPFDLLHGTDTGSYISGADLPSVSLSALYSTAYLGIAPSALMQALSDLPFQPEGFTFVDLGCGKGRALMVAAAFPFRRLTGVEIATGLWEIARANLATYPDWASRISVHNEDATNFTYPDGPLLVFLFHPFLAPVLRRVLANLERTLRCAPRETWILYARDPHFHEVIDRFPFLREVTDTSYPLSKEDAAVDLFQFTQEQFTLYSTNLIS